MTYNAISSCISSYLLIFVKKNFYSLTNIIFLTIYLMLFVIISLTIHDRSSYIKYIQKKRLKFKYQDRDNFHTESFCGVNLAQKQIKFELNCVRKILVVFG